MNNKFFTVCGLLPIRGKILLVRHNYGTAKNRILLPGGYVQEGELPTVAAEREIYEETGVCAGAKSLLAMQFKDSQWCAVYLMEYLSGEPKSDGFENSEVLLLSPEEAVNRPDITNMSRALLQAYMRTGNQGLRKSDYIPPSSDAAHYVLFQNGGTNRLESLQYDNIPSPTIHEIRSDDLPTCLSVIHESFGTVADEFGLTRENCPKHTAFLPMSYLETQMGWGWRMYGLFEGKTVIGYMSLSDEGNGVYELHNLAVLPTYRHKGFGKLLLDHAKAVVRELDGKVIKVGIIEESTILKKWYMNNGFEPVGTRKFDHLPFTSGYLKYYIGEV